MPRRPAFLVGPGIHAEHMTTGRRGHHGSRGFNVLPESKRRVRRKHARALGLRQSVKVERMNRTLAQEWQYGRAWESEAVMASALSVFVEHCNWSYPYGACGACRSCRAPSA